MNAMTQAMNMAEEPGTGQPGSQPQQVVAGRGQATAVRRRWPIQTDYWKGISFGNYLVLGIVALSFH